MKNKIIFALALLILLIGSIIGINKIHREDQDYSFSILAQEIEDIFIPNKSNIYDISLNSNFGKTRSLSSEEISVEKSYIIFSLDINELYNQDLLNTFNQLMINNGFEYIDLYGENTPSFGDNLTASYEKNSIVFTIEIFSVPDLLYLHECMVSNEQPEDGCRFPLQDTNDPEKTLFRLDLLSVQKL